MANSEAKYYKSKQNDRQIIRVAGISRRGFAIITGGDSKGFELLSEWIIDDYYIQCRESEYIKANKDKKENKWKK